jgi:hypothetical protein
MNSLPCLLPMLLAAAASAQPQVFHSGGPVEISYQLWWTEVSAAAPYAPVANPNGLPDPGEGIHVSIRMDMYPNSNTPVTYPSSLNPGSAGAGTLASFWLGGLDVTVSRNGQPAAGAWVVSANTTPPGHPDRLGTIPPFAAGQLNGVPSALGDRVANIAPAQFSPEPLYIQPPGPVERIWSGLFVPDTYAGVWEFTLWPASNGMWPAMVAAVDNLATMPAIGNAAYSLGTPLVVGIPAPGAAGVLLLAAAVSSFRRLR